MNTFEEMGIRRNILEALKELGFENPMPIQIKVIPHLMESDYRDIVALAQTGTGKTAAFGVPIIEKTDPSINKIQYLILSPTRELCLQISDDLASFAKYLPEIKIAAVFGGASIERQIQKIQKGVHIVSATPGRLVDLINRRIVNLKSLKTVVLDEADEMLSMGFRDDLEAILKVTPEQKNTLLFSATMPKEVAALTKKYMTDPLEISVGTRNAGAESVEHFCYLINAKDRYLALKRIVDFNPDIYGIIFCRTRKETQEVADLLMKDGYNADSLHGDLSQAQRDIVMNKFRIRHLQLLVATDVAARGLDVDHLTHIINYNLPEELEIYTHRSGRTGRAGRKGISIVIAGQKEKGRIQQIEKQLKKKFSFVPVPSGKEICERQLFHLIDRVEKVEVDYSQIDPMLPDIFRKLEWLDREELIKKFVSVEFNRFLEYYKKAADLNSPREFGKTGKEKGAASGFARFFINLGRTDDLKPNTLMGLINEFTGIDNIEIGKIELLKNFSFFEVDSDFAQTVLNAFKDKSYKKRAIVLEPASSKGKSDSNKGNDRWKDKKEWKESKRNDKSRPKGGKRDGRDNRRERRRDDSAVSNKKERKKRFR
ncbi:MAG TPA: DEAD/DEAH box helicase [Melioribacteraceae bacterium]|nr:DEAD/DEAH box helicase [Melioribacteraceae bacterium]